MILIILITKKQQKQKNVQKSLQLLKKHDNIPAMTVHLLSSPRCIAAAVHGRSDEWELPLFFLQICYRHFYLCIFTEKTRLKTCIYRYNNEGVI